MKVLVFGGTFNPPHLGHQLMIEQVLSKPLPDGSSVEQVWILPVGKHSFAKQFVDQKHRLAMLELMIESLIAKNPSLADKVLVETYELERAEESQTFTTLEALAKKHPDKKFSFLIGSDNLAQFHLWHHHEVMLSKYPFYIYPRMGFPLQPLRIGMIALNDFPQMAISSTAVRQAFAEKSSLKGLLDDKVIAYIKANRLFIED